MQTLIIVAHPEIENSPTQQFLKASLPADQVTWHELQANGKFDRQKELALLEQADRVIFQFPLYWYSAPYILKKWQDEVFSGEQKQYRYLAGKELGLVVSLGQSLRHYQAGGSAQYSMSELLRPYQAFVAELDWRYCPPLLISNFSYLDEREKQDLLIRYQQFLTMKNPADFSEQGDWLLAQLATMGEQNSAQNGNLKLVSEQLEAQLTEYQKLTWEVAQIKLGEVD